VPVKGLHLFTDSAMFPWDKPDNVLQTRDLLRKDVLQTRDLLRKDISSPSLKDIPADLNSAWLQLAKARQP
jgi:hypothetical protein